MDIQFPQDKEVFILFCCFMCDPSPTLPSPDIHHSAFERCMGKYSRREWNTISKLGGYCPLALRERSF